MLRLLHFLEFVASLGVLFSVYFYAPFARDWKWALGIPYGAMMAFCALWAADERLANSENNPAPIYLFMIGLFAVAFAALVRGLKLLLFKIPALARLEERVRQKWKRPSA